MSQQNVDRYLESTEAFNRRDVDGWVSAFDPEIVFEPAVAAFEGSLVGHDGLKRFFADVIEVWETYTVEYDDVPRTAM